ncbi:MAG: diguanylate cyclase, partial [Thermoanaerobaculia bacterium]|nr:diguanylate cyclase [Thermoanaerobaculia bacterium]
VAAHRNLGSAAASAARQQLAPATNQASELSVQRHWQLILPVVNAPGNQFAQRMGALDQEMLSVARAHLTEAVDRVARFQKTAVGVAAASLALAISLGLTVALALARRLLIPIRSITRASEAIEGGDLSARAVAISEDEVGRLARRFNGMADRLERRNREVSTLHDLSQLLQTAGDAGEAFEIFERLTPVLLPGGSGTVHVISPSRVELELRARFGSRLENAAAMATPNDCWALRKGQTHLVESVDRKLVCAHLGGRDGLRDPYACLPLVSQNETLGLLHVAFAAEALDGRSIESRREELEAIANALGLALGNLALREKLKSQSVRDALTGLYNRRFLEEALPREIERCRRRSLPLIVGMADLDHFKRLNDSWGHEAGDLAIQRFAETLRRNFRQEDILCRYGGEEFCLVLPECSLEDARRRCDQLLAQMRDNPIQFGRESVGPVTVSLGLVAFPDDAGTVEQLIRAADAALYRAKQTGRDRIVKFHPKFVAA